MGCKAVGQIAPPPPAAKPIQFEKIKRIADIIVQT